MTISPSKVPKYQPYTNTLIDNNYNLKERLVYCEHCKYKILTNLRMPICGDCHRTLYEYVKSHFDDLVR